MDQISPPMRIVLAVAVLFVAAWMLVLKPKDESAAPAATPATPATASAKDDNKATTGLGKAVESARGAKDAVEAKQDKEGLGTQAGKPSTSSATAAAPSPQSAPSKPKSAKPADPSLAKLPDWLQRSMDKKVVAILFTNGTSADDRRTARALRHAYTAHGQVVTRTVPIARIAKYRPVAQGVDVQQSPTLMVIDRDRGAQALVGFSSGTTINQAIVDGLLATNNPVRKVAFLLKAQRECRQINTKLVVGPTEGSSPKGYRKNLDAALATMGSSLGSLRNAPVPGRYRPAKRMVTRYIASEMGIAQRIKAQAIKAKTIDAVTVNRIDRSNDGLQQRALLELNAVGVSACN